MKSVRNVTFGLLVAVVMLGVGSGRLKATSNFDNCWWNDTFEYGVSVTNCHGYAALEDVCPDLQSQCEAFCQTDLSVDGSIDTCSPYYSGYDYAADNIVCTCDF